MKLITHPLDDGSGAAACVCVCTYDERSVPAGAGFIWNQIAPKAWATTSANVAAKLWQHADETTIKRLLKAGVVTQDQHDQRIKALEEAARFTNPRESKRDRAEELAIRLAGQPALIEAIRFMLKYLAARCDGAVKEDGQGFNGTDTSFGHELAARATLSPKQAAWAQIMLWKYMGQLGHLAQFNEVYGAEAEAERQRLADVERQKLQQRMAGKVCKAHQRQITFLGRGKRVGFCDECRPAEAMAEQPGAASMQPAASEAQPEASQPVLVQCAGCQQPLAEDDQNLLCPQCRGPQQHPVNVAVDLLTAAGLADRIDPAKVDAARRLADAEISDADVISPMPVCWKCGAALDGGRQCGCPAQNASGVAVDGPQQPAEASAPIQTHQKPASGPVREVAGLLVAADSRTDGPWAHFEGRLVWLNKLRETAADETTISSALDEALMVASKVAKAEAKAGNIIKAARR